jgi:hypothetical protein
MHSLDQSEVRLARIARIAASKDQTTILQRHVADVVKSSAFHGSPRCGHFLEFIVNKSLTGQTGSLKERTIGIEVFGRNPTYDTAGDSIVRVTASEVRKRLLQHYGRYGTSSKVRISLPLGSYIPEITIEDHKLGHATGENNYSTDESNGSEKHYSVPTLQGNQDTASESAAPAPTSTSTSNSRIGSLALTFGISLLVLNVAVWAVFRNRTLQPKPALAQVLPWSFFFNSPHPVHLITSDPAIFQIQTLTAHQITISDYANHNYFPVSNPLPPQTERIYRDILRGDKLASSADPPIVAAIASLAQNYSRTIDVEAARNIQFSDLKDDDNFIFLGSPLSNPWTSIFDDQLDFRFDFEPRSVQERILNVHPRPNELKVYNSTAPGWETGESFAIIALVKNPDQNGRVLLIAGISGEGTSAAGKLVTEPLRLASILQQCNLPTNGATQDFELLLKLNTLAGSPHQIDPVACHKLP